MTARAIAERIVERWADLALLGRYERERELEIILADFEVGPWEYYGDAFEGDDGDEPIAEWGEAGADG